MSYTKDGGPNSQCRLRDHNHAKKYCPDKGKLDGSESIQVADRTPATVAALAAVALGSLEGRVVKMPGQGDE